MQRSSYCLKKVTSARSLSSPVRCFELNLLALRILPISEPAPAREGVNKSHQRTWLLGAAPQPGHIFDYHKLRTVASLHSESVNLEITNLSLARK